MPGGDRTGPMGMGPMTGRGAGYCAGFAVAGFAHRAGGGGFWGRGRGGGGRGRRNMFYATGLPGWARTGAGAGVGVGVGAGETAPLAAGPRVMSPQEELEQLKQQAQQAARVLEQIQQRIDALAGESRP